MVKVGSQFSQLLQQISRLEFRHLVTWHEAEHGAKGFASWIHKENSEKFVYHFDVRNRFAVAFPTALFLNASRVKFQIRINLSFFGIFSCSS